MINTFSKLLWIFFVYSLAGWLLETNVASFKERKFVNRGVMNGPICIIYGIGSVVMTVFLYDLRRNPVFLFVGCAILGTFLEWTAGKFLEKVKKKKWWDYSNKKWNLDGYICVQYSLLWGLLGVLVLEFVNPLLIILYKITPGLLMNIILIVLSVLLGLDVLSTYVFVLKSEKKIRGKELYVTNSKLLLILGKAKNHIGEKIDRRMKKAYPDLNRDIKEQSETEKIKKSTFAYGCSFYKIFLIFFIGSFIGDIVETVFCRYSMGRWMSRSSVVWGPFSVVWGLAMAIATLMLFNYRNKSNMFIFIFGTVLGGAYEYICSVFTEIAFGKVFWDYSKMPLNLGGRINLLYCGFWGLAALIWLKKVYPFISKVIEKIPVVTGKIITWILILFMTCNVCVSAMALVRYNERHKDGFEEPSGVVERFLDQHFNDDRMKRIYPNAKTVKK